MTLGAELASENAGDDARPWELSLAAAQEKIRNLELALQTSRRIGMAVGILMARYRLREDEAFGALRRASQNSHRKIREIADEIVYTGDLVPPVPASGPAPDGDRDTVISMWH